MRGMAPIGEMAPTGEMAPGCGKRRGKYFIVFSHPHRRDGTGCDLNDVNPRVSATALGPRGDIRAPLLSRTITNGTRVVSTLFTRGNESSCFHLIGMKIVRSQPSSKRTYVHAAYSPPDHRRSSYGTTVPGADEAGQERQWEARGPKKQLCHKLIPYVTTHHGR